MEQLPDPPDDLKWEEHGRDWLRRKLAYMVLLGLWLLIVVALAPDALSRGINQPLPVILGILLGMLSVLPHELIHAIVFRIRGFPSKIVWKGLKHWRDSLTVSPKQSVDRRTMILVLVAPFVVLNAIGIGLLYVRSGVLLSMTGIWILFFNIVGSDTDWYDIVSYACLSPGARIGYVKRDGDWILCKTVE